MLHQWSILLYQSRGGRISVVRRKDSDPAASGGGPADPAGAGAADTGAGTGSTGTVDAGAGTGTAAIEQPGADGTGTAAAAEPDPFAALEGLFPKDDEPAAGAVDPNAANAGAAMPEAVSKALGISDYVKDPAQLESAVRAAQELWDVASGKVPAASMLEGMRANNPAGFEKMVLNDLIPYIEQITGKKLGAPDPNAAPDPVAEMRAKIADLERRPEIERQERELQQRVQSADTASRAAVEGWIKTGSGIFDGDTDGAIQAIAAQLPKLGIDVNKMMAEQLQGKTDLLEKAYKAAEKAELKRVKAATERLVARSKALRNGVPATKGSAAAAVVSDELPLDATREEKVEWMRTGKFTRAVQ
jgi:hypothetical protein